MCPIREWCIHHLSTMDISVYVKLEPNIASNERPDGLEPSKSKDATHLCVVLIICHFSMGHHSQDHSESTIFFPIFIIQRAKR